MAAEWRQAISDIFVYLLIVTLYCWCFGSFVIQSWSPCPGSLSCDVIYGWTSLTNQIFFRWYLKNPKIFIFHIWVRKLYFSSPLLQLMIYVENYKNILDSLSWFCMLLHYFTIKYLILDSCWVVSPGSRHLFLKGSPLKYLIILVCVTLLRCLLKSFSIQIWQFSIWDLFIKQNTSFVKFQVPKVSPGINQSS